MTRTSQNNPKLCDDCRGSCCKAAWVDNPKVDAVFPEYVAECLAVRGRGVCPHLTPEGRCGIYATRPFLCRVAPAGEEWCLKIRREFGIDPPREEKDDAETR
jgi:Fe-S-cluster containining protein